MASIRLGRKPSKWDGTSAPLRMGSYITANQAEVQRPRVGDDLDKRAWGISRAPSSLQPQASKRVLVALDSQGRCSKSMVCSSMQPRSGLLHGGVQPDMRLPCMGEEVFKTDAGPHPATHTSSFPSCIYSALLLTWKLSCFEALYLTAQTLSQQLVYTAIHGANGGSLSGCTCASKECRRQHGSRG